jgi:hypothetical protein
MYPRRFAGLAVLLSLALFAHGGYYHLRQTADREYIEVLLASADTSDAEQFLLNALQIAFKIPTHLGPGGSPEYGVRHPLRRLMGPAASEIHQAGGHCGRRSRLLIALLRQRGIPAHKVHLINEHYAEFGHNHEYVHAVVEVRVNGKWVIADPLYNLVYRLPTGELAGLDDLQRSDAVFQKGLLRADTQYVAYLPELYTYSSYRKFLWSSLPVVGELSRRVLSAVFGDARINEVTGPAILESPYWFIAVSSYLGSIILLALAFILYNLRPSQTTELGDG